MIRIKSKVIGNERQLTVGVPRKSWRVFNVGERIEIRTLEGDHIVRKVRAIGNGKQRIITIPSEDWDIFKKGNFVFLFPVIKYETKKDKQNDKQDENVKVDTQI